MRLPVTIAAAPEAPRGRPPCGRRLILPHDDSLHVSYFVIATAAFCALVKLPLLLLSLFWSPTELDTEDWLPGQLLQEQLVQEGQVEQSQLLLQGLHVWHAVDPPRNVVPMLAAKSVSIIIAWSPY